MLDSGATFRCSTHRAANVAVVHAEGEIDLSTASSLGTAVMSAFAESGCVIADLSRAEYLDGAGIRVLRRAAEMNPSRVVVVAPRPTIRRLFRILNLVETLPVVDTLEEAYEYLRSQGARPHNTGGSRMGAAYT